MILPIIAFGNDILKAKCVSIEKDFDGLDNLITNMWDTMYNANGVGLAAPQVGKNIRLFIVDASPFSEDNQLEESERNKLFGFKKVFINPKIVWSSTKKCNFNEGCLSIPDIREDVSRDDEIEIHFQDEKFSNKKLKLDGLCARVVQHEYDHIEGILFTDKISSFKRKLLSSKLKKISKGNIQLTYPMTF